MELNSLEVLKRFGKYWGSSVGDRALKTEKEPYCKSD